MCGAGEIWRTECGASVPFSGIPDICESYLNSAFGCFMRLHGLPNTNRLSGETQQDFGHSILLGIFGFVRDPFLQGMGQEPLEKFSKNGKRV